MALAGTLGPRETYDLVSGQMAHLATREMTWDWLRANYAEFVEQIPAQWRRRTPGFAGVFCEAEKINELEAFFADVGELASGHERALAQTVERIELCDALTAQGFSDIEAALSTRR
jgi:alanyl aminopeptidase